MTEGRCAGCGDRLPSRHGNRKWCTEACRKRYRYGVECATCGQRRYHGHPPRAEEYRCQACRADESQARWEAEAERLAPLWNIGMPRAEIAERLGYRDAEAVKRRASYLMQQVGGLIKRRLGGDAEEIEVRRRQLIRLVGEGYTNAEIASILHFKSRPAVAAAIQYARDRHGCEIPRGPERTVLMRDRREALKAVSHAR